MKTWTSRGFVDHYLQFFIHPGTRWLIVSGVSANPDGAWMKQQARIVTGEAPGSDQYV